jgi:hypothetical protein
VTTRSLTTSAAVSTVAPTEGATQPPPDAPATPPTLARITRTWWPLAASWLFMSIELPALVAVIARLPEPAINLAAYGGVVFPLALIIESPVIMLLAASTALSRDWGNYRTLYRYMMWMGAGLTALHLVLALTPLYFVVVEGIIGVPEPIVAPARIGLILMTPWTWAIAYRRYHQGVLIRFGRSQTVGVGTAVRLVTVGAVLIAGYNLAWQGIVVGTVAVSAGVIAEAIYVHFVVQPVLHGPLRARPAEAVPINARSFWAFYFPLVMTSFLILVAQPIGSAAISRLPNAIASLAVWPAISGLMFILRSPGIAYNEVVVALLDEPKSAPPLRRFAGILIVATTALTVLLTLTPLASFWLRRVQALAPELATLAESTLWLLLPLAGLAVLQSWYQGVILHARRTRGITEAVAIYLLVSAALLALAVYASTAPGLASVAPALPGVTIALATLTIATIAQTVWLWLRSRPARRALGPAAELDVPDEIGIANSLAQ